jgi:hypothetical protein
MSVDLGMLEVWWVPSGLLNHVTYGQFVAFSMNIDECAIERFRSSDRQQVTGVRRDKIKDWCCCEWWQYPKPRHCRSTKDQATCAI